MPPSKMLSAKVAFYARHPLEAVDRLWRRCTGIPREEFEVSRLLGVLPPAPVIIEAGASRGMDTVQFASLWPRGRILAVEPEPGAFAVLEEATRHLPNVERFPLAFSTSNGRASLHVSSRPENAASSDSSSLLPPKRLREFWPGVAFGKVVDVETVMLNTFLDRANVDRVDFMWLDMQGMEMDCLRAAAPAADRIDRIYSEVFLQPMYAGAPLWPEAKKIMADLGFRVQRAWLNPLAGDVLFVRRGLAV